MQRFQFSLERVLKWKNQMERMAEQKQKQAHLAWEAACFQVAGIHRSLEEAAKKFAAREGQVAPASSWASDASYAQQLGLALEKSEAQARQAEANLKEAIAVRSKAAVEVETLLALERRQLQEHARQAARLEQERMDEIGLRRWQSGRAGEPSPEEKGVP